MSRTSIGYGHSPFGSDIEQDSPGSTRMNLLGGVRAPAHEAD
jgi:hypothetical protein